MKGSRLYSVLKAKCPVCHEGKVFEGNTYDLSKLGRMYPKCPNCGHRYEKDPGFFYGAMYVSYALTVTLSVIIFAATYLIYPEAGAWLYIGLIVAVVFVLAPLTFRVSRLVWMNFFDRYDPLKAKKK